MKPVLLSSLAIGLAALLAPQPSHALKCPPPAAAGAAGAVPGKPGETGWKLDTETDDKGNVVDIWCLKPNAKHGGDDFGYLWTPKGGASVWVGACVFGCGQNKHNKQFVDKDDGKGGGKPNGRPDEFTRLTWFNAEPPPAGTKDWAFSFNPATGKLTISKTEGTWSAPYVDPKDGKTKRDYKSKVVDSETVDPPSNFEDLKFKGTQLTLLNGDDGAERGAFAALVNPGSTLNAWDITLRANAISGSGTAADPYNGLIASIFEGDTFTLGGLGIANPQVSGLAASSAFGGWVVSDFDSSFVTFMATADVDFAPGTDIPDFFLSSADSTLDWNLASVNEEVSSSGILAIPEPGTFWLALAALLTLAAWRQRSRVG